MLNCRFISILDNLDSFERPDEINSVFVRFKHIMNDHYSSEISLKLRRVYDAQRKEGKLVSSFAPYGYIKDPKDNHHLIIDNEVADVVRNIFAWYVSGMGSIKIAKKRRTYNQISKDKCPKSHSISHELLVKAVLHAIRAQIYAVANMQKVIDKIGKTDSIKTKKINFSREITKRRKKIKTKTTLKKGLYEDWKASILSRDEFINMKKSYDDEIQSLEKSICDLKIEERIIIDMEMQNLKWMNKFVKNYDIQELSRELLSSLIDKIYVDANTNIHIQFKYQDQYTYILKYVKNQLNESESSNGKHIRQISAIG